MVDHDQSSRLSNVELASWLEWASARLLATPSEKIKPRAPGCLWPEYSQDKFEIIEFRARIALRALAPSSDEIPIMDEILLLPNLCKDPTNRRIIRMRSLVNPLTNRYLYKWPAISKELTLKTYECRRRYGSGLDEMARKIDRQAQTRIGAFLSEKSYA